MRGVRLPQLFLHLRHITHLLSFFFVLLLFFLLIVHHFQDSRSLILRMILQACCSSDVHVRVAAMQCLVTCASLYYSLIDGHMNDIFQVREEAEGRNEDFTFFFSFPSSFLPCGVCFAHLFSHRWARERHFPGPTRGNQCKAREKEQEQAARRRSPVS